MWKILKGCRMSFRRDGFPRVGPFMAVPLTRVLLRRKISVNSMDALFHIDWTWMMHAQERKDCQRVQQARDIWKRRAVVRGEDRRRSGSDVKKSNGVEQPGATALW